MKSKFRSIYDYLDNDIAHLAKNAKGHDSKKASAYDGENRAKLGGKVLVQDEEQSLKSDTDTFDDVNPYRRVATPPMPLVYSEKSRRSVHIRTRKIG